MLTAEALNWFEPLIHHYPFVTKCSSLKNNLKLETFYIMLKIEGSINYFPFSFYTIFTFYNSKMTYEFLRKSNIIWWYFVQLTTNLHVHIGSDSFTPWASEVITHTPTKEHLHRALSGECQFQLIMHLQMKSLHRMCTGHRYIKEIPELLYHSV